MSEYAQRDTEALGDLYMKHLVAMTDEGLHFKGDIAAELAFRDAEVGRLREKLSAIDGVLQKCDRGSRDGWPGAMLVIADIVEGAE